MQTLCKANSTSWHSQTPQIQLTEPKETGTQLKPTLLANPGRLIPAPCFVAFDFILAFQELVQGALSFPNTGQNGCFTLVNNIPITKLMQIFEMHYLYKSCVQLPHSSEQVSRCDCCSRKRFFVRARGRLSSLWPNIKPVKYQGWSKHWETFKAPRL